MLKYGDTHSIDLITRYKYLEIKELRKSHPGLG